MRERKWDILPVNRLCAKHTVLHQKRRKMPDAAIEISGKRVVKGVLEAEDILAVVVDENMTGSGIYIYAIYGVRFQISDAQVCN
jgi:hypothetical protein